MDFIWKAIVEWLGEVLFSIFKDEKESKRSRFIAVTIVALVFGVICGGFLYMARDSGTWTVIGCIFTLPLVIWYGYWLVRIFRRSKK